MIEDTLRMKKLSASVYKGRAGNAQQNDTHFDFLRQHAPRLCRSLNLEYKNELGKGPKAIVVLAEQSDGESVAVKISRQNLQNETENMNLVEKKGGFVPRVHRVGEYFPAEISYLQMDVIPAKPFPPFLDLETTLRTGIDVAKTLYVAHTNGIIHNDVKPRNILSTDDKAYLIDWGCSRLLRDGPVDKETLMGTLCYIAPERFSEDTEALKGRVGLADQYSLGATLYKLLVGTTPYNPKGDLTTLKDIDNAHLYLQRACKQDYLEIAEIPGAINVINASKQELQSIDEAIRRMMHPNPLKRYSSIIEVAIVLNELNKNRL